MEALNGKLIIFLMFFAMLCHKVNGPRTFIKQKPPMLAYIFGHTRIKLVLMKFVFNFTGIERLKVKLYVDAKVIFFDRDNCTKTKVGYSLTIAKVCFSAKAFVYGVQIELCTLYESEFFSTLFFCILPVGNYISQPEVKVLKENNLTIHAQKMQYATQCAQK